jgi:hypothetical protein
MVLAEQTRLQEPGRVPPHPAIPAEQSQPEKRIGPNRNADDARVVRVRAAGFPDRGREIE